MGMEIKEIRKISIADFLAQLGHEPVKRRGNELWYHTPYRDDLTPSFRVNSEKQLWYDFGFGRGGDIFNLAGELIHSRDFMAQAKFISETANVPMVKVDTATFRKSTLEPSIEKVEVSSLRYVALKRYLEERSIPMETASRYCSQLNYMVHKKVYFAIGFPNVAGGYEIRNKLFKGCVPPKDVSLVKTDGSPTDVCSVFEGFMDFLSAVTLGTAKDCDCLVLNSVANVEKAMKHLNAYGRIDCYLDRDEAGRRTLATLKERYGERVCDRSALYDGCKDLNEYLQHTTKKQNNNN